MSTYTPADIRKMVDELDDIMRGAIAKETQKQFLGRKGQHC
jgi:hypothetical protein